MLIVTQDQFIRSSSIPDRESSTSMSTQKQMKQWVTTQDGLQTLEVEETAIPIPQEGEVLVKINAVSLNFRDIEGD